MTKETRETKHMDTFGGKKQEKIRKCSGRKLKSQTPKESSTKKIRWTEYGNKITETKNPHIYWQN